MDGVAEALNLERDIERVMAEEGVDRAEAITLLGLRLGEVHGDGDLVSLQPLTDDQRAASGLGRSIAEVLAAQRMRRQQPG